MLGTLEPERLKVTALNLSTRPPLPLSNKLVFSYYDTTSKGRGKGSFDNTISNKRSVLDGGYTAG